ncbi:S-adenosyl-L-methionine-dependent methyltransferase [Powellomyces hirtus]|nr:S-adenosyl-L-methionine-dependent methyltransferase [Powellomyces hirtus]
MASRAKLDARFLKLRDEIIEKIFSLTPEDGVVFDPQTTKFLDYACGVGMNSEKIAPRVAYIAGMDISPKSVEAFNNANIKTASAAIARATLTDLTTDPNYESTNSAYTNFDVALCSMAFHHMPSPALAAKAIASRLKEGGTFIMVEFKASQVAWEHRDTVHKHGFTEKEIMDLYNAAGMEVTRFIDVGEVQVNEGKPPRPVFLAVGKKI